MNRNLLQVKGLWQKHFRPYSSGSPIGQLPAPLHCPGRQDC